MEPEFRPDPKPAVQPESPDGFPVWAKFAVLLGLLYIFMLSVTLLGASFNPLVALVIGILATAIIQSSSTTTSVVVGLVGSGILSFQSAVPIIMGANIGTTVTNSIVSLAHISRGDEFRRAFAGSTVHDFFNLCAVIVLLPLEVGFGLISKSAEAVEGFMVGFSGVKFNSPLAAATKPLASEIAALLGNNGWLAAILALIMLFFALRYIVKTLKSMVLSRVERFFQRYIFRTPVLGFILGIFVTVLVQSSSITTSLVVPLIGAGVITLSQIFPYMLGANIGTTITAFLASFVTGSHAAVTVAFAHLLFNIYGIAIFWPAKRIPIKLAFLLANYTQRSKLIPIVYILIVFFIIPAVILFTLG